jgi:hypothetical protein
MAVVIHLDSTTRACGKLDVIFSVAIRDNGRDAALPRKLSGVGAHADLIRIGFSPIGESTVLPIALVIDGKVVCQTVALSEATRLLDGEKLEVLRRLDQFRQWHSLDEKRYCLVCGKLITGRQIQVTGGTRGNGPVRLSCPTQNCNSIAMDWVLPTDEILARVEKLAEEERKASALQPAAANGNGKTFHRDNGHEYFVSRLRRLAFHLKRHA